jgi:DNA-binding transcriptional LysR family regulator
MITELRTLIAVSQLGTFSAAGDRIGLTQSAVSSQIKRLEESLGFPLFDRTARSATLNAAGSTTVPKAEEIVRLFNELADLPNELTDHGLLRIGAISSVQSTLLTRALRALRKSHPTLPIKVIPGVSMQLMNQLDAGEIDLAIMIRPPFGLLPELKWHPLVREPFVFIAPATTTTNDWSELIQSAPFLRYERTSFGGRQVERFLQSKHLAVHDSVELDDIQGIVRMVASGLGVALIPMAETYLPLPKEVQAISLEEHTFYREIGILQRAQKASLHSVLHLCNCLRDASTFDSGSL